MDDIFNLSVKAVIINEKGKVLLLRRFNGKEYWDMPGGILQKGEDMEETLIKEVKEEIGFKVSHIHPFGMTLSNMRLQRDYGEVGVILALYLVELNEDEEKKLENKKEYHWYSTKEAADKLSHRYPMEVSSAIKEVDK